MKKQHFVVFLFSAIALSLTAKTPVFVDIAEANQAISDMQAQNDAATQQTSELTSENDALEQDNQKQRDRILEARQLISDLSVSRGELYAARNRTNDMEQKKRVVEQLEKNMIQENQLLGMIDRFNGTINDNNIKIAANKKQIARNNIQSDENLEEITYLQACVELTSNNEGSLEEIFSRQDSNSSAFDSFMSANQE
ncbi:MAG: hypothetical protein PQJ60_07760 [Spirochaetales bacterium]|nr:hypothetical protein [Spirochaetales bacterium]